MLCFPKISLRLLRGQCQQLLHWHLLLVIVISSSPQHGLRKQPCVKASVRLFPLHRRSRLPYQATLQRSLDDQTRPQNATGHKQRLIGTLKIKGRLYLLACLLTSRVSLSDPGSRF
ncbi:hypothetical protein M434DRAFT_176067 [Hypoxylon sp. CO27-5]|nr:hypothetical protein M434DRAFT_176067 [Hypoxylon sp. CO27-5]